MNPGWFTVIGVIVGAIVGGGAQIVANLLTRGESRRHHRNEVRREAYSELLTAANEYAVTVVHNLNSPTMTLDVLNEQGRLLSARFSVAIAAPEDTAEAAKKYVSKLFAIKDQQSQRAREGKPISEAETPSVIQEQAEFLRLAKRDLSLSDDPPPYRQRLAQRRGLGWLAPRS